jgi:tetrahydromethanopterin S-methyltransferase subunit E
MNYVIVPSSELSSVDFSEVIESESTLRYSLDNSKFIVKYEGEQPSFAFGLTKYNRSEMKAIVSGAEWTPSE